jgi:hypothetical protein
VADIVTSRIFSDGEKGITAAKLNDIVASSSIQTGFYTSKSASTTLDPTDLLMEYKAAGAYATITGDQLTTSVSNAVTPAMKPLIWSVRQRSFNAIGNPTFEVDQRTCFTGTTAAGGGWIMDRWGLGQTGSTMATTSKGIQTFVPIPGTSYNISQYYLRILLTGQQASLAAGDSMNIYHQMEGVTLREICSDVMSLQVLVRSTVAGLKFGINLRDAATTKTLALLGTIPSANVWTLLQFPNLPSFLSSGMSLPTSPGNAGTILSIGLAVGTTGTAPSNGTWISGNYAAANGQDNFASKSVSSTFDCAFCQLEPGPDCSGLMDCPFTQNYDACLRYFAKSYEYGTAIGTATTIGQYTMPVLAINNTTGYGYIPFPKPMAKAATIGVWNSTTGAGANVQDGSGTNHSVSATQGGGSKGFTGITFTTAPTTVPNFIFGHYTADTGW